MLICGTSGSFTSGLALYRVCAQGPAPIIFLMWPTVSVPRWRATGGSGPASAGPAMMPLRSLVPYLATMIRWAGIAYIFVQVAIWHSFYAQSAWRLAAPALAVAWAVGVIAYLRKNWPSRFLTVVDSAAYAALALAAQAGVPPEIRDTPFSCLGIAMSRQLILPAWYAPGALSVLLTLASPLAYLTCAE